MLRWPIGWLGVTTNFLLLTALSWDASGVELRDQTGRSERFDAVILTLPLGVLKAGRVTFTPGLPARQARAIARLGMGLLDKVYLRFDDIFWDARDTWIWTPETGLPRGQFNQWLNLAPYTGAPVIMAFNAAGPARALAALSDADIVARAQSVLAKAYPL